MTYTFKIARRLASNHPRWLVLALSLSLLGCASASNLVLTDAPGALTLTIDGLASGAQPQIELTGPDGYQKTVTYSGTISGLPYGTYQVQAHPTTAQSTTWTPSVEHQTVTLTAGTPTASALVHYTLSTGALDLRIEGLPTSTAAAAHLTGPAGFALDVASSATLRGLAPGSYTITAGQRIIGSATYLPVAPTVTVNVVASLTPAVASITFSHATASLQVSVTGLPVGAQGQFVLSGPGNYNAALTGAMQLEALDPGNYIATALPVVWQGHTWSPVTETTPITVDTGTTHLDIDYQLSTGALAMEVEGLPTGATGQFTVSGPSGFSETAEADREWVGLWPGTYTTTATAVIRNGRRYTPTRGSQNFHITPGLNPVRGRVTYSQANGSIAVTVSGVQSGTPCQVIVIGPNSIDTLESGGTLGGLADGSYTIVANPVGTGSVTLAPVPVSQVVTVAGQGITPAVVNYVATTGSMQVTVAGLPLGAPAAVTVTGPGGYSNQVSGTTLLSGLAPGNYSVTAATVTSNGTSYTASPASQAPSVTTGATANVGVSYTAATTTPTTGSLAVSVSGLPSGTAAAVSVSGPGGYSHAVTSSTTLTGLAPGSYTVAAAGVTSGGTSYTGSPASQTASVTAGASANAAVSYAGDTSAPGTATLGLSVTGLPSGATAAIMVNWVAGGYSQAVTGDMTLTDLGVPGTYQITASDVTIGGQTYHPNPASGNVYLTAGMASTQTIDYQATGTSTGSLAVTVGGLPGGTAGAVTVTGPSGYSHAVTATTTLSSLAPGSYTITAAAVSVSGTSWTATPASQTASVTAGGTTNRTVTYATTAPSTGSLTVTASGLPGGTNAAITVTGPGGYSHAVTATTTLTSLTPGSYTIAAAAVSVSGTSWTATPASQTASVTAGGTTNRAVTYATTAPSTGNLSVAITGLPGSTAGAVTVSGPGGFNQALGSSATLSNLAVGTYTIAAGSVSAGGTSYVPSPSSQTASVTAGGSLSRSVDYAAVTSGGTATVTVDESTRYQVMTGWEATAQAGQGASGFNGWKNNLFDQAVNDLGITRLRVAVVENAESTNDNNDPNTINMAGFNWSALDLIMNQVVMPMKQRVEARGEHLYVNLNYTAFRTSAGHLHSNPAEYAEFILAAFLHLQSSFGVVPDGVEVILEPDNGTFFGSGSGTLIGQAIVAAGARLAANGFHPDFIAPSVMAMSRAPGWIDNMLAVPGAANYVTELSYHRYSGVSDANLAAIWSRAAAHGMQTSMLEHIASGVEDLYKDLTIAHNSSWQQYTLAYPTSDNGAQYYYISGSSVIMGSRTKQLWQYFHYVRPGAQRVGATSQSGSVRPVAFTNPGGGMAVVLHVDAAGSYTVAGLRPGSYEVTFTNGSGTRTTLPSVTATAGGQVTVAPSQTGILTLSRI